MTAKDDRKSGFFRFFEILAWKHRNYCRSLKALEQKIIFRREELEESNFLLVKGAGLLRKLGTET